MPPQLTARLKQAGTAIGGMTLGQKVIAVIGIAALLLGGTALAKWASKPDYAPLYTGLSAQDADSVTQQLTKDGVSYQLADGGGTILVPAADVDAEKLSIAGAGIVTQNTSGYALLDKTSITSSEFQQQVTYQRAMEGELANTIEGIDGVDTAVVHLAIPQQTVYTDKAGTPTASVLVGMKDGKTLTDDQVQSIVNLVSSSVPSMKSDEVTVTDSAGDMLAQAGKGITGGSSSTDAQTQSYDTATAAAVQAMLDKVLGTGKSLAHVNATLDFDSTKKTSQTYSYTKGVPPISQSVQKEAVGSGSSNGTVGGALGSNGVLGMDGEEVSSDSASASASASPSPYISEDVTQDNAVNSQTEKTTVAPGQVSRQSVAVVVDSAAAAKVGVKQLDQMVSAAAGIDTTRGDVLSVTRQPFDTSAATSAAKQLAAAKAAQAKAAQLSLLKQGVIGLGVLLLALLLFIAWRRSSKRRRASAVDLGELERLYNPTGPVIGPDGEPLAVAGAPSEPVGPQLTPAPADPASLRRAEVGELVDSQPAEVAELLRGWLTETRK